MLDFAYGLIRRRVAFDVLQLKVRICAGMMMSSDAEKQI